MSNERTKEWEVCVCTLLHFHLLVVDVVDSRVAAASARRTTTRPSFLFVYLFIYVFSVTHRERKRESSSRGGSLFFLFSLQWRTTSTGIGACVNLNVMFETRSIKVFKMCNRVAAASVATDGGGRGRAFEWKRFLDEASLSSFRPRVHCVSFNSSRGRERRGNETRVSSRCTLITCERFQLNKSHLSPRNQMKTNQWTAPCGPCGCVVVVAFSLLTRKKLPPPPLNVARHRQRDQLFT